MGVIVSCNGKTGLILGTAVGEGQKGSKIGMKRYKLSSGKVENVVLVKILGSGVKSCNLYQVEGRIVAL